MNNSHIDPIVAIAVLFPNDRAVYLDELASAIRRNTGKTLSRSALLRAMTKALTPLYREWLECGSEDEIERKITARLSPSMVGSPPAQRGRSVAVSSRRRLPASLGRLDALDHVRVYYHHRPKLPANSCAAAARGSRDPRPMRRVVHWTMLKMSCK
jgi:hypothetical protein